ncbi:MAG: sugar phosphate nucleotidyltransferase [candidate division WOR-3 bacterium]
MPLKSNLHSFSTIILAAGISKRMHTQTPKILYRILGKAMIQFVVDLAYELKSSKVIVVVSKKTKEVEKILGNKIQYAIQEVPRGTGDAAKKGIAFATSANILILYGDVPLLQKETISGMIENHLKQRADLSILTCELINPSGYGRIVRDNNANIVRIVEDIDATKKELTIKEINTGIYFGSRELINKALSSIRTNNKQKEFYLTDIVHQLIKEKKKVIGFRTKNEEEILGINTKSDLARVREILKKKFLNELMLRGVYIEDPTTTNIDLTAKIGKFVHIRPFTFIEGNTFIKDNSIVGPFVWIKNGRKILKT